MTEISHNYIERLTFLFPNLNNKQFSITSPPDTKYNCIAWAAGDITDWWDPDEDHYWPPSVPREVTLDAVIGAFKTLGYEECRNEIFEPGHEKVAVYGKEDNGNILPTHAARQLKDGQWTSKLGELVDIKHSHPEDLSGNIYGKPIAFLRRFLNLKK